MNRTKKLKLEQKIIAMLQRQPKTASEFTDRCTYRIRDTKRCFAKYVKNRCDRKEAEQVRSYSVNKAKASYSFRHSCTWRSCGSSEYSKPTQCILFLPKICSLQRNPVGNEITFSPVFSGILDRLW